MTSPVLGLSAAEPGSVTVCAEPAGRFAVVTVTVRLSRLYAHAVSGTCVPSTRTAVGAALLATRSVYARAVGAPGSPPVVAPTVKVREPVAQDRGVVVDCPDWYPLPSPASPYREKEPSAPAVTLTVNRAAVLSFWPVT